MAQFLIEEGEITAEEARYHPSRNFLLQCVGCGSCEPETGKFESEAGNLIILTTDGLHGLVPAETISSILSKPVGIQTKANILIKAALDAGGKDNVTIVVAKI
jgi:protein phosphatase